MLVFMILSSLLDSDSDSGYYCISIKCICQFIYQYPLPVKDLLSS